MIIYLVLSDSDPYIYNAYTSKDSALKNIEELKFNKFKELFKENKLNKQRIEGALTKVKFNSLIEIFDDEIFKSLFKKYRNDFLYDFYIKDLNFNTIWE
jgi:hypothetical protein